MQHGNSVILPKQVMKKLQLFLYLLLAINSSSQSGAEVIVPAGGNSWVTPDSLEERITAAGWENWQNSNVVFTTYIKVSQPGSLKVKAAIEASEGESKLQCTIAGKGKTIKVSGNKKEYMIGEWHIRQAGYVAIQMSGISRTGPGFGKLTHFIVSGSCIDEETAYVKNNEDNYFYWGRRGPSVHLSYDINEAGREITHFYSEIEVPEGNDVTGSYYMANGFAEGYFGMQVNSPTERRILFSVWSPFQTDDPRDIPDDQKILMLRKGEGVYTGEFGNEGSGGQSFLRYSWKTGIRYRFLLQGIPVANNYTNYTAYFYAPEENKWRLIASFSRPKTHTYLTRFHSFLENFIPGTGNITRKAWYLNQWVRDKEGNWFAIGKTRFTADATAQKKYRLDYAGGIENGRFFLKNDGFFNESTPLQSVFILPKAPAAPPEIDFEALEKLQQ